MKYTLCAMLFLLSLFLCQCAKEQLIQSEQPEVKELQEPDSTDIRVDYPDEARVKFLMGRFEPSSHEDFVPIHESHADRSGMLLDKRAYLDFVAMFEAAQKDGIQLQIISATRNFERQKQIWEAKWSGDRLVDGVNLAETYTDPVERALKILEWSSMPGSSRHHWGTDIDLNDLNNEYFEQGKGKEVYEWLLDHANTYGFCQPYSQKGEDRPWGYHEEKWHWSYMPLAREYLEQIRVGVRDEDISGFQGAETAPEIGIVEKYILGINKDCQEL